MLKRIYIDNFRCFVNFECRFSPSQLVLGTNGTGKSTLFEVIGRLRNFSIYGDQNDMWFGGFTRTRWQNVAKQSFELDVEGHGGLYTFKLQVDSWGNPDGGARFYPERLHSANA